MATWTDIAAVAYDLDSPLTVTLIGDIIGNTEYNNEHALRCGTHLAGVRQAYAHGSASLSVTISDLGIVYGGTHALASINFSTATDGDPVFTSTPSMWFRVAQTSDFSAQTDIVQCHTNSLGSTAFEVEVIVLRATTSTTTVTGTIHWFAIGPVTSGE